MTILAVAPNRTFCRTIGSPQTDFAITDDYAVIDMRAAAAAGVALDFAPAADVWVHCIYYFPGGSGTLLRLLSSATEVLELSATASQAAVQLQNTATTSNIFTFAVGAYATLDVHLDLVNDLLEVYLNGSLAWSTSYAFSSTTVNELQVLSGQTSSRYREVIVANEPTIAMRLDVRTLTGAGASQDQVSGTVTDIDDQTPDQATGIVLDTADRALFTVDAPATIPGGLVRRAVVVAAEARRGDTGPANLRLTTRSGSTNTDSPSFGLSTAYAKYQHVFDGAADPSQIGVLAET